MPGGPGTRVVGYVRLSPAEHDNSDATLEAQRRAITETVAQRSWTLIDLLEDSDPSVASSRRPPGLEAALARVERGEAEALVVARLDRLSRSVADFGQLVERAIEQGWKIVLLDMDLDMTTAVGERVAKVLASFAEFEHRVISQRTREGLAARRTMGVRLGRPRAVPEEVVERIRQERAQGLSYGQIAERLNDEGVPTAQQGRQWYSSSVRALLRSREETPDVSARPGVRVRGPEAATPAGERATPSGQGGSGAPAGERGVPEAGPVLPRAVPDDRHQSGGETLGPKGRGQGRLESVPGEEAR